MDPQINRGAYHRLHVFTLPTPEIVVVSPITGTAYTVGEKFAEGCFGHVFNCTDEWCSNLVAKVLKPLGTPSIVEEKATLEVLFSAIARSPYTVHVHDAFIFRGAHYIISERCEFSVRDMLSSSKHRTQLWFPALAKAVLHSLHFMHVQGLAHCDVHAGNVFLGRIPDALLPAEGAFLFKVGDFGQARPLQQMTFEGTFHEHFRPPEAIDPDEFGSIDHRCDIYQAGILFLSFLTGHELRFSLRDVLRGQPRELAEALPSPFGPTVAKMLRRHVAARPATCLDVWRELNRNSVVQ